MPPEPKALLSTRGVCILLVLILGGCNKSAGSNTLSGTVLDREGPIEGAVVRIQTSELSTTTDSEGRFSLPNPDSKNTFTVTAWKYGYYIAGQGDVAPGLDSVEIYLEPHTDSDNPWYDWLPSLYHPGEGEDQGCAECHSSSGTNITHTLPVDEWLQDSHSRSAVNPRFLSMYNGTDVDGNQSPLTQFGYTQDYGTFPLPPDPDLPYYGPGYKLDFPDTSGNCAACHAPVASINNPYQVDLSALSDNALEGISCDFCHKIWDIKLNLLEIPYDNMPGVLSYEFRRPPEGHQLFIGPLDDVAPGEDTYSALQGQSQYCAGCHYGIFWDTVIYNSYSEWLESPYSDPEKGQQCQDCHMPSSGASHFALPEKGGLERDPVTIFSHTMPGAGSENLLQNTVSMAVQAERQGDEIMIAVSITNDQAGHHVPTDSPLRHLILVVNAFDSAGNRLILISGPLTPDWVGIGESSKGYYAGLPGKVYAKVLMERWTQITPTGAYWNPTKIVSDNRLAAYETDLSNYVFRTPEGSTATIQVSLLYRRAFLELAQQKGWDTPDILMEEELIYLP